MNLSVGIVGLPNVGKSTLFNALLKKQLALAANYPFATIEPNVGVVAVPDERLRKLAEIVVLESAGPAARLPHPTSSFSLRALDGAPQLALPAYPPIKPAMIEFVDIAGLVKGASEGAGLGNKFLSHIREVKVICQVVRAFTDEDVVREGSIDPESDYNTIKMELMLADLQTLSKQRDSKAVKTDPVKKLAVEKLYKALNQGDAAREVVLTNEEIDSTVDLFLLSNKSEVVVLNVDEKDYSPDGITKIIKKYSEFLKYPEDKFVVICAKIESELSELSEEEQKEYLKGLGLTQSGLERLIEKSYETLGLISFLTAGEKEVRAWTIKKDTSAQIAAGEIHTDFIKKFIKAEVVNYKDFVEVGGWKKAREVGKARQEGRDYIMQDGDVVEFKIGS
ncbi:redox-regulated ATPase YchF [Patescibacteria group bacterium]|nr:redox-regulated ATPase YchF [Patescibacteria group bacterium]MBU4016204.1 redox-regulated ATPase YchF [Patescibacteria group bacterium]MBU4098663.1 redox-regulated ATPase YchF [Patescibacteria group bacterium]